MGLTLGNGQISKPKSKIWGDFDGLGKAVDSAAQANKSAPESTSAKTTEDFGAVDVEDFESFEGSPMTQLRDAHSNQRRAFGADTGESVEGDEEGEGEADVRVGEASLAGSRKRQRSPTGATGTSSKSPSIRI